MTVVDGNDLRDKPMRELVVDLSRQVVTLARQEVELAKAEMTEKGKNAGLGIGILAAAGIAALLAAGALTAFLILALDEAMPAWLAAVIVTALWAVVAGVLALLGKKRLEEVGKPVPEKTLESVKEDMEWLREQTR
jgi:MFS family permease